MSDEMKRELAGLSADVGRMRGDITEIRGDINDIRAVNRRVIATLVRLEGKFDDMAERMVTKDEFSAVSSRIDGLAGKIDDMRYDWAKHEARIGVLEKRRS